MPQSHSCNHGGTAIWRPVQPLLIASAPAWIQSAALGNFSDHVSDGGARLAGMGSRMVRWGEKIGIETAVLSEGANKLDERSDALSEPALAMNRTISTMAAMTGLADSDFARIRVWSNRRTDGDEIARPIQNFGLSPEQANQLAMAAGPMAAGAGAAHAPFSEVLALSGEVRQLMGGRRGPIIFASMVCGFESAATKGKVTIDFSRRLIAELQQLQSQLTGTSTEKLAELGMGFGSQAPELLNLINDPDEAGQKQIADSNGALGKAYGNGTADAVGQIVLLHQNVSNLYDAIYSPALPTVNRWLGELSGTTPGAAAATEHRSSVVRYPPVALTGVGAPAYYGLQGLASLHTISAFAGEGVKLLSKFADSERSVLRATYACDKVKSIGSDVLSLGKTPMDTRPSRMSFGAARLANSFTWDVAGAVALAFADHEIYKHWGPASAFLEKPGEGPLREAVLHFGLGEELAKHIKPAPVIAPAREIATRITQAPLHQSHGAGGITINLTYSPTIHSGAPADWVKAAREHADELMRIIDKKLERRARLEFA